MLSSGGESSSSSLQHIIDARQMVVEKRNEAPHNLKFSAQWLLERAWKSTVLGMASGHLRILRIHPADPEFPPVLVSGREAHALRQGILTLAEERRGSGLRLLVHSPASSEALANLFFNIFIGV